MATSLTTDARADGVHCMTDDGTTTVYIIKRDGYQCWRVCLADLSLATTACNRWATLEAAEFYALALHADTIEREREQAGA